MMKRIPVTSLVLTTVAATLTLGLGGCSQEAEEPTVEVVTYQGDVLPILKENCVECHVEGGKGLKASGLSMESYDGLMKGTEYGPIIKPGDAISSSVVMLLEGRADPSIRMPHGKKALEKDKVEVIKAWIDQGAKNN